MKSIGKYLVNAESILTEDPSAFVLIDVRSGAAGTEAYQQAHLRGALHANLEWDLADKPTDPAIGGRHPLPELSCFAAFLGQLGVEPATNVVLYDDKNGANAASRLWWMLRAVGHQRVYLIDGGYQAAVAAGFPVDDQIPTSVVRGPYPVQDWSINTVAITEMERISEDGSQIVIDVRDAYRYLGEREPIDRIAGHIPGATNIPFSENLDPTGKFLSGEALLQKYRSVLDAADGDRIIVHCGSGVTACHTLFALANSGIESPKLYVGSWSEWSNAGKPVATGHQS